MKTQRGHARSPSTKWLTCGGVTRSVRDWEIFLGLSQGALWHRIKRGWPLTKALRTARVEQTVHGESHTRLHDCWTEIKRRCFWSGADNFHNYGGRGITMHPPWARDYRRFAAYVRKHIGDPKPGMSIDRSNNERGYVPGNIRWADRATQSNNTRRNVWIEHDGKRMTIKQWAAHLNVNYWTLFSRIRKSKMPIAVALTSEMLRP